ncbi:MAG: hypothetical protein L6R41_007993 [Letrouitia leprolyta]|nr:MAG: hypothetical protein L6R41_007993 [Letrouitia leprolyta]
MPPKPTTFPHFLALPAKIRQSIYEFVLCFDGIEPHLEYPGGGSTVGSRIAIYREGKDLYKYKKPNPEPLAFFPIEVRLNILSGKRAQRARARREPDKTWQMFAEKREERPQLVWLRDVLQLLRTCKMVYEESKGVFWAKNQFFTKSWRGVYFFARCLGPKRMGYISCLGTNQNELWKGGAWLRGWTEECATEMPLEIGGIEESGGMGYVEKILRVPWSMETFRERIVRRAVEGRVEGDFSCTIAARGDETVPSSGKGVVIAANGIVESREEEDLSSECVVDRNDTRNSVDILGETIEGKREERERREELHRGWRIEFEEFPPREKITWLTNRPKRVG